MALLTTDMVTREALRIAHEKSQFLGTIDRSYDDSFAKSGAKIGSTLRVRLPNQYTRTTGSRVMDLQEQAELSSTIVVATQDHVDMPFNSADLALSIDDFSARYIAPAMSVLVSGIESDALAYCTKATYNVAGTAGTALTDLVAVGQARAKLNQGLAPKDGNRFIQADSVTMGGLVNGLKGLFQDSAQIKEQYREGMIGRTAMADWYENDRAWSLTNGSDIVCTLAAAAAVTDGGTNITMASLSAAPATGSVFTINNAGGTAGVYMCHPETKASLGTLQQFVITTPSTTAQTVSPAIYLTGPRQNVCASDGSKLTPATFNSTALIPTFVGAASTTYVQNLMYHKEAFQFVTADLPLMGDSVECARRTQDGLSLRVWQKSDIVNDRMLMRIDCLYGIAALRPAWASRIIGAAS
jgi:hypothetical protein